MKVESGVCAKSEECARERKLHMPVVVKTEEPDVNKSMLNLPVQTLQDLQDFERFLQKSHNFSKLVSGCMS